MRNLAFAPLALLCIGAAPPQGDRAAPARASDAAPPTFDDMNAMRDRPDCVSIRRQVAGEDRRYDGTRLDRQPPGRLILAVERRVNGCPEVVFANEQRRSGRPAFPTEKQAQRQPVALRFRMTNVGQSPRWRLVPAIIPCRR